VGAAGISQGRGGATMIQIMNEKLFTMTEILESARLHFRETYHGDIRNGCIDFELNVIATIIGESLDFVRGYVGRDDQ